MMLINQVYSPNHTLHGSAERLYNGRSNKYRKWHFWGWCQDKPLDRLTYNLAETITSGTPFNTPNGMSIGLGA